ncbi:DNRLRE domain-containing protein [Streptomyces showdoensis]|uniref:DNRLRE domain-containing protein n=1 Tax=Streptomyces showdoensis TaxID=68268 RepID=UPI001F0A7B9E|nr:DNRLRE domain-containing protein [Streptomyces showdoensis]
MRTRTRLSLTLGLVLAALTAALLPWWQPNGPTAPGSQTSTEARNASVGPRDEATAVAEAKRTGKKVLVETATTETQLIWAQPNGKMLTQIDALPQRAKNAEGNWAPIDTTLHRTKAAGPLNVSPANAVVPVRFSSGSGGGKAARADRSFSRLPLAEGTSNGTPLAEVELGGHTVTYTWPTALPEPVLDGPRALYPEVFPGVDLLLVARAEGGFGQVLIVKNREAAKNQALSTVKFGMSSKTAVFRQNTAANVIQVLDRSGQEIGSVPTPFAWDSAGRDADKPGAAPRTAVATPADVLKLSGLTGIEPGAKSAQLPVVLDGDGTGELAVGLKVAETKLLSDADTAYPVFIDPPLNTGFLNWTVAYKKYPSSSFWNGTNFSSGTSDARVGYESDTGGLARSFWQMRFSTTYKYAKFDWAYFKVKNNHSWSCTERQMEFWLTGGISSGTTWNAQPSWAKVLHKKSFAHGWSSSCPDEYESFTVTSAAQEAADKGWSNITFGMRATSESDTQTWRKFAATGATLTGEFNRAPTQPTSGTSAPGGACVTGSSGTGVLIGRTNITLKAKGADADGNLSKLRFRFWKDGGSAVDRPLATPDANGWAQVIIPATDPLLKDITANTTFLWDVRSEDSTYPDAGSTSSFFPDGSYPCRLTVDPTAPPQPDITSTVFDEATPDGKTWAKVNFGKPGDFTFTAAGATRFSYGFEGQGYKDTPPPVNGKVTLKDVAPPHAGPIQINVFAYDANGNQSLRGDYSFYLPPRDTADGPMDTGGDGVADLLVLYPDGKLKNCVGAPADPAVPGTGGELYSCLSASYVTAGKKTDPPNHWIDAAGNASLIAHYNDVYPGDGSTDLFAVTPDKQFWLYPGDGYGSFNVDQRIKIRLPSNAPAPSTWTQMKAIGDVTGDKNPDIALRAGNAFWILSGYTGATFQTATLMEGTAWARRDIVNIADMNKDGTPDLLWRNLDNGNMYARHGKPGPVTGSVDLESIKVAANSLNGDVAFGTNWTEANVTTAIGLPDVNKDGVPDIWARFGDTGNIKLYYPSTTNTNAPVRTVLAVDWRTIRAFG